MACYTLGELKRALAEIDAPDDTPLLCTSYLGFESTVYFSVEDVYDETAHFRTTDDEKHPWKHGDYDVFLRVQPFLDGFEESFTKGQARFFNHYFEEKEG